MQRRVGITGLGIVTPLGEGRKVNWARIVSGDSAIGRLSTVDTSTLPINLGAEIKEFNPKKYVDNRKILKLVNRNVLFGLAAAKEAVEDSAFDCAGMDPYRVGVYIGSGEPGAKADEFSPALDVSLNSLSGLDYEAFGRDGIYRIDPYFLLKMLPNNLLCYISMQYNAQGPNSNVVMSGVAGAQAIGEGFKTIQDGYADVVIAGGYDSFLETGVLQKYGELGLFPGRKPQSECIFRPFDRNRDGFLPGEGAAVVILEELSHAEKRGARVYAELAGYGCGCDGYHLIDLPPDGRGTVTCPRTGPA